MNFENYNKDVEILEEFMIKNPPKSGICSVYFLNKDVPIEHGNHACHASMNYIKTNVVGNASKGWEDNVAQNFLEWLTGPDSVYYPVIKKAQLKVVRHPKNNKIIGVITHSDINNKALTNYFKSFRTISEHKDSLEFWRVWVIEKKKPFLGVSYLLSYFYDKSGSKITRPHSSIEQEWSLNKISLSRFLFNDHEFWDLDKEKLKNGSGYNGENKHMWSPKNGDICFIPHKDIPRVVGKNLKTRFYKKYNKNNEKNLSVKDLENFYDNILPEIIKQ